MFPGTLGTDEGQWELRPNPEGGTASHGREGHAALLAGRWEGRRLGEQLFHRAERGQAIPGDPCRSLQPQQAKAACIATPGLEVGAQGPLPIATSLCSLWTLLSSSWPKGPEEE